jgi:hypothetical protein
MRPFLREAKQYPVGKLPEMKPGRPVAAQTALVGAAIAGMS